MGQPVDETSLSSFVLFFPYVLPESRQTFLQAPGGKSSGIFTSGSLLPRFNVAKVSYWTPTFGFQNKSLALQLSLVICIMLLEWK